MATPDSGAPSTKTAVSRFFFFSSKDNNPTLACWYRLRRRSWSDLENECRSYVCRSLFRRVAQKRRLLIIPREKPVVSMLFNLLWMPVDPSQSSHLSSKSSNSFDIRTTNSYEFVQYARSYVFGRTTKRYR